METLPQIITSIVQFITNNLPAILEMGIQLIVQLTIGLVQAIPQLIAALPQIIAAIVLGLGNAVGSVFEIGKNIVAGLWEGILSMGSWLSENIGGFFSGIVDGAKNLLGIHSPSTVFAGIGTNMGLGIGMGFTDAMKSVEEDMKKAIPTQFDGLNVDVDAASRAVPNSIGSGAEKQTGNAVTNYEIVINNPKPELASESVRTTLLKHSYGLV
jgi:phage-related protein